MNVIALSNVKIQIELRFLNCEHLLNITEIKDFSKLITYNKNIDKMLNKLISQVKLENSNIENVNNDIIKENKKCEKEIQNIIINDNFEENNKIKSNIIIEINDDITYKKFDIKLKEIVYRNQENNSISSSTILKDGRFAVGYSHGSIIM